MMNNICILNYMHYRVYQENNDIFSFGISRDSYDYICEYLGNKEDVDKYIKDRLGAEYFYAINNTIFEKTAYTGIAWDLMGDFYPLWANNDFEIYIVPKGYRAYTDARNTKNDNIILTYRKENDNGFDLVERSVRWSIPIVLRKHVGKE